MKKNYVEFILIAALVAACVIVFILAQQKDNLQEQKDALIIQNVQLTKQNRAAVSNAYKAGIIDCTNEDVAFLNETANEYSNTLFAKILREWADTWAYEDDTIREMVEDYMSKEVH